MSDHCYSLPSGARDRVEFLSTPRLQPRPNHALQPTAASALRLLAVPSPLRASAAAEGERWASHVKARLYLHCSNV
jgi:hypothetical protein